MRGFRLNGWQRIGIVLSVVWAIAAGLYVRYADEKRADEMSYLTYTSCVDATRALDPQARLPYPGCDKRSAETYTRWINGSRGNAAFVALAPIPIAWLLVWGLVALVRWIRRGFKPST